MANLGSEIFRSRFSRRLLAIFILSSVLPVITLSIFSFYNVSNQLIEQSKKQLYQENKAIGLAIFEKLSFLKSEFNTIAKQLESNKQNVKIIQQAFLNNNLNNHLNKKLVSLALYTDTKKTTFFGNYDYVFSDSIIHDIKNNNKHLTKIFSIKPSGTSIKLFMSKLIKTDDTITGILIGEINANFIINALPVPEGNNLCLMNHLKLVVACLNPYPDILIHYYSKNKNKSISGSFEWFDNNTAYVANYREIFLKNDFSTNDWTVLLTIPQNTFLHTLTGFQRTFLGIIAITVLAALMLSISLIRKVLTPLKELTQGIDNLGNINFSKKVHIKSNDEFEDLATSFNNMSSKLDRQFHKLETMADIDHIILSSLDSEEIVKTVLTRIHDILQSDHLGIIIQDYNKDFKEIFFSNNINNNIILKSDIKLSNSDKNLLCSNIEGINIELKDTTPLYLDPLKNEGARFCFVVPLFWDKNLLAIIILGYHSPPADSHPILSEARSWGDRITVALSNAKWQEKLYYQAHYDTLTKLPNRLALKNYLAQTINRTNREQSQFAILLIDLDRFKLINDSLGHNVGDQFLKVVSKRINNCIRTTDMVSRLGGDEFIVVLSDNINQKKLNQSISMVADKLLKTIDKPFSIEGHDLHSTASIGVAIYPNDANTIDDLIKNADLAMYHAKSNGGDSYQYFCLDFNIAAKEQLLIENDLRVALKNDELEVYLQPQVDTFSGALVGAEALVRWNHPIRGFISPASFIPIAEETILIADIDLWVLNSVCQQLNKWSHTGYSDIPIAINLSARLFQESHVTDQLSQVLSTLQHGAQNIVLEITEGSLIGDFNKTLSTLNDFNSLGVKLALDDFGTGYSSLSYLKKLPIHKLKIDQSFIRNCDSDEMDASLVKTIIHLSHNLNMQCVAEGVETQSQLDFLRQQKCDVIQGYFYSPPLSIEAFTQQYMTKKSQLSS